MKAKLELDVKPFMVPNFVTVQSPAPAESAEADRASYPLSALDPNTLDRLCDEFRDAVFKKAGKQQPPQVAQAVYRPCPKCDGEVA
jgi:hypothetical protein